ncbi:uncharacterized protein TrAFT101_000316 [Trichoderma asperellum]|uniref:uncharacterized protein n=1 Tax=Trichoderma asperellum TaxID=101201 RepID=UPI0033251326|nr:hypothetical protein TrAFT101_000316 [Trichoderma asperellum]
MNFFSRKPTTKSGSRTAATNGDRNPKPKLKLEEKPKPTQKPRPKPQTLRIPDVFENGGPVFVMSATHRGDMYHLRAALQLENCSIVLYDSNHQDKTKIKTNQLEEYLAESVLSKGKHIFVVPWEYGVLSGRKPLPENMIDCLLDRKDYNAEERAAHPIKGLNLGTYSEKTSTELIASAPERLQDIVKGMAIVGEALDNEKSVEYQKLSAKFADIWKTAGIEAGKNNILLMYRDTGTRDPFPVEKMGVYPELDNGNATKDIWDIVDGIAKQERKAITIFTCGLKGFGIGEYWNDINGLKPSDKITARDFEAYFLKWSYKHGYYKMASGFRSGALDLFTFMGIPTVSIGLRNLMGESRHKLLAKKEFKRVNIQYDQPRHETTAAVTSERWASKPGTSKPNDDHTVFGSPFWEAGFQTPQGAKQRALPRDKKAAQMKTPGGFAGFDRIVIEVGYRLACHLYMNLTPSVYNIQEPPTCVVSTHVARFCYPNGTKADQQKYVKNNEGLDRKDLQAMKDNKALQQSKGMVDRYERELNEDWTEMRKVLS